MLNIVRITEPNYRLAGSSMLKYFLVRLSSKKLKSSPASKIAQELQPVFSSDLGITAENWTKYVIGVFHWPLPKPELHAGKVIHYLCYTTKAEAVGNYAYLKTQHPQ